MSTLNNKQHVDFNRNGYLVFEKLISDKVISHYLPHFEELVIHAKNLREHEGAFSLELNQDGTPIPGMLHKIQGICVIEPIILELASEAVILDRIEDLIGPIIDVFGTKFFPKLAGGGTSTHWHQDNFYFGTNSAQIISCVIYLQDADETNGCLQVVPGSHHSGAIHQHLKQTNSHGSWTNVEDEKIITLPVAAGTVIIFSANLLHGTCGNNNSTRSRYSTAWHYVPGDLQLERFPRESYKDRHIVRGN